MTKINKGNQFDDSRAKVSITAHSDSQTEINLGDQHDRSTLLLTVVDALVAAGAASAPLVVLFVAANPNTTSRLQIDEEFRAITEVLRAATYRDEIALVPVLAARPDDLVAAMNQHKPAVVHFSGHGDADGRLIFAGTESYVAVDKRLIAEILAAAIEPPRCVLLNACYSAIEVEALTSAFGCVVSMKTPVADTAACSFARSFYRAMASGAPLAVAFQQAVTAVTIDEAGQAEPVLSVAPHVDPHALVLVGPRKTQAQAW